MKVYVWDHAQMYARRAALAVIAGGIIGCTAHAIPSSSGGTLPPDARTDGSTLLFDDPTRAIWLANFDLSDREPPDPARSEDLAAPIGAPAEFDRLRRRGSEYAVLRLPRVRLAQPLTTQIQPSWKFLDRATELLVTYNLDHAVDLTEACEPSIKAKTVSTFMLEGDALYMGGPPNPGSVAPIFESVAQWIGMPEGLVDRVNGHPGGCDARPGRVGH